MSPKAIDCHFTITFGTYSWLFLVSVNEWIRSLELYISNTSNGSCKLALVWPLTSYIAESSQGGVQWPNTTNKQNDLYGSTFLLAFVIRTNIIWNNNTIWLMLSPSTACAIICTLMDSNGTLIHDMRIPSWLKLEIPPVWFATNF